MNLGREDKGVQKDPGSPSSLLGSPGLPYTPRCGLCQRGTLEGPSPILSGHNEGLRDGETECGGTDSGGGSVSGGGTTENPR